MNVACPDVVCHPVDTKNRGPEIPSVHFNRFPISTECQTLSRYVFRFAKHDQLWQGWHYVARVLYVILGQHRNTYKSLDLVEVGMLEIEVYCVCHGYCVYCGKISAGVSVGPVIPKAVLVT